MRERQDVILGAGLAGLTAALTLQELGQGHWQTYEQEQRVGGHARSILVDGYTFDFGPHILFTSDEEIEALIKDLLGDNFTAQAREAYLYHHEYGVHTRFPFQAHLHGLPPALVARLLTGLVRALEAHARGGLSPGNYDEWMRQTFGDAIAEHLMIPYARKVWTVEPSEMDFSWIDRRVPTPDFERVVAGALSEDVAQVGATAQFWYPKSGGIEALAHALGERVEGVHLGAAVERIDVRSRHLVLSGGERVDFDRLIYTLPLSALRGLVPDLPSRVAEACDGLRYQGVYCLNVGIDRERISDRHWVYFYEDLFPFHRLSFPANFSPENTPAGKSSISMEISFSARRPLDEERVTDEALSVLKEAGLLRDSDRLEVVHGVAIEPAYVIYDLQHARNVATIRSWLARNGISTAGRFGEWEYLNMDHAMRSGRLAAKAIVEAPVVRGRGRAA